MKKNDFILIGIVLFIGLGFLAYRWFTRTEGDTLIVNVDGQVYRTFDLNEDTSFTIEQENGEINTFTIKDGYVDMEEANCPDKRCVHQRDIHFNNEKITCLPNNVILEIKGVKENNIDGISR